MAIGTTAAILGSAAISAGASALSAKSSKKAINQANEVSAANNAANNELARETYAKNEAALSPYTGIGNQVNPIIASLLGYGGDPSQAQDGLNTFRNATGFQDQLYQGMRSVTNNAATSGLLGSGATLKALQENGTNLANNSFTQYLNALLGQQGVGASAASALAGVGTNFSNQITTNNNLNATNQANGALARAGVNNQNIGNIANSIGGAIGAFGGSGSLGRQGYSGLLAAGAL